MSLPSLLSTRVPLNCQRYVNRDSFCKIKCHCFKIDNSYKMSRICLIITFFFCQEYVNRDSFYKIKCHCFDIDDNYKISRIRILWKKILPYISQLHFFFNRIHLLFFLPLCHYTNQFNHKVVILNHTNMKTNNIHFNIYMLWYTL